MLGALLWVNLFIWAGYFFGNIPVIKDNFGLVTIGIIVVSMLPMVVMMVRARVEASSRAIATISTPASMMITGSEDSAKPSDRATSDPGRSCRSRSCGRPGRPRPGTPPSVALTSCANSQIAGTNTTSCSSVFICTRKYALEDLIARWWRVRPPGTWRAPAHGDAEPDELQQRQHDDDHYPGHEFRLDAVIGPPEMAE